MDMGLNDNSQTVSVVCVLVQPKHAPRFCLVGGWKGGRRLVEVCEHNPSGRKSEVCLDIHTLFCSRNYEARVRVIQAFTSFN